MSDGSIIKIQWLKTLRIIMKKDSKNEYIGIVSLISIVILAVLALYYFFSYRSPGSGNANVPIEATPVSDNLNTGNGPK